MLHDVARSLEREVPEDLIRFIKDQLVDIKMYPSKEEILKAAHGSMDFLEYIQPLSFSDRPMERRERSKKIMLSGNFSKRSSRLKCYWCK